MGFRAFSCKNACVKSLIRASEGRRGKGGRGEGGGGGGGGGGRGGGGREMEWLTVRYVFLTLVLDQQHHSVFHTMCHNLYDIQWVPVIIIPSLLTLLNGIFYCVGQDILHLVMPAYLAKS